MTIEHAGKKIECSHGFVEESPVDVHRQEFYAWGLKGVSTIYSGTGGMDLSAFVWLHGKYNKLAKLAKAITDLRKHIGIAGTLNVTIGTVGTNPKIENYRKQVYSNTMFVGFEPTSFEGRSDVGPIFDDAETVDGGWIQPAILRFRKLE